MTGAVLIDHSFDIKADIVTISASEVLAELG